MIPIVVLGPLGGVVADRFDRRRVMITCDVARIALMLLLALFVVTSTAPMPVEILTDTGLQRMLDEDVFGRAYGLALPASLGGIVVGSLVAPLLAGLLGGTGALLALGLAVLAYPLLLLRRAPARRAPVTGPVEATAGVLAAH